MSPRKKSDQCICGNPISIMDDGIRDLTIICCCSCGTSYSNLLALRKGETNHGKIQH